MGERVAGIELTLGTTRVTRASPYTPSGGGGGEGGRGEGGVFKGSGRVFTERTETRQEYIFLNGVKFRLIDTAGIREKTSDEIEKIGIKKTFEQIERADIILVVTDLSLSEISELKSIKEKYASYGDKVILCGNKSDLVDEKICNEAVELGFLITSSISKNGIDELENKLINFSAKLNTPNSTISNIRHYDCLTKSNESIIKLIEMINADLYTELIMQIRKVSI